MLIRKLHRMGTSTVVTVPQHVMRRWEQLKARHVIIEDQGDHLVLRPLTLEELIHYPIPEEEDTPHGPVR
jgi:antitoxin component of MazEF toxin-antitoxin module